MLPFSPSEVTLPLRTYRVTCLLTVVLIPAFGYVYHWQDTTFTDPLWLRWTMALLPLGLVVGTYTSRWVLAHLEWLSTGLIMALVSWFGALTGLNDLAPEYAVGYLFTVAMIGVATPNAESLYSTAVSLVFAVLVAGGIALSEPSGTPPLIFWICVAATATAIFIGTWLRQGVWLRMQASESRYRAVFNTATGGLFLTDAETYRFLHANEAYLALTGYTLDELRALTLYDVTVAPSGFLKMQPEEGLKNCHVLLGEQQHRRKDGSLLDLEIGASAVEEDEHVVLCMTAHDLTEQKRIRAEKEQARVHTEEMLRMKSTLLDTMGHELRTPLAGILGFSEVLAEEVPEEQRDLVYALHQNAHRLSDTLSALLDLAQLRGGETKINIEVVDVAETATEVADMFRHRIEAKGLGFRLEAIPASRSQLDREALRRLLSHLLSNATKFTERGEVALSVNADEHRVFVHVADTGIGMHEDDVPMLFNAFEQASTGLYRVHEGTGLGLSITKQLVDLMGGRIKVQSTLGEGTTFTVSFARTWASPDEVLDQPRPIRMASTPSKQPKQVGG